MPPARWAALVDVVAVGLPAGFDGATWRLSVIGVDPRQTPSFHIKQLAQELTRMAESELRPLGVGMAQTLVWLERDGMIRTLPHASNKRVQLIAPTEVAEKILPQSKRILEKGNTRALQGFTPDETRCLLALLQRMHGNLVD